MTAVPAGFERSGRTGPFVELIGPLYTRTDEQGVTLGLRAEDEHVNARGRVHGAVLCGLLDIGLGRNVAAVAGAATQPVTVSLNVQMLGSAGPGEWLEVTASVPRVGRRIAFGQGTIVSAGRPVATATAVYALREPE